MTLEHYVTAGYYIGVCLWLVIFMFVTVSMKELLYDNGKKVHVANTEIKDILNLAKLMLNGKSPKVRVSAGIHLFFVLLLVIIPVVLLSLQNITSN